MTGRVVGHKPATGRTPLEQDVYDELIVRDKFGKSRFETACILGNLREVKRTCEMLSCLSPETKVAAINKASLKGYTTLHHACAWGRVEVVKVLLENGANCNVRTVFNETPKRMAEKYGKTNCLQVIAAAEVRRNVFDKIMSLKELALNPKRSKNLRFRSHALSEINLALEQLECIGDLEELLAVEQDLMERVCIQMSVAE